MTCLSSLWSDCASHVTISAIAQLLSGWCRVEKDVGKKAREDGIYVIIKEVDRPDAPHQSNCESPADPDVQAEEGPPKEGSRELFTPLTAFPLVTHKKSLQRHVVIIDTNMVSALAWLSSLLLSGRGQELRLPETRSLALFLEVDLGRTRILQTIAHAALVANQSALFTGIPLC